MGPALTAVTPESGSGTDPLSGGDLTFQIIRERLAQTEQLTPRKGQSETRPFGFSLTPPQSTRIWVEYGGRGPAFPHGSRAPEAPAPDPHL